MGEDGGVLVSGVAAHCCCCFVGCSRTIIALIDLREALYWHSWRARVLKSRQLPKAGMLLTKDINGAVHRSVLGVG